MSVAVNIKSGWRKTIQKDRRCGLILIVPLKIFSKASEKIFDLN